MTEHNKGMLIVVSGPSGVGKDTVVSCFLDEGGDKSCVLSVSATTRAKRPDEKDGYDYYFIGREEFLSRIAAGEMLEYAEYNGNYYGTPKEKVDRALDAGKNVILIIEVQGARKVRSLYPRAVLVFIRPPSVEVLRERLICRATEDDESIARRMETAKRELAQAGDYDYILTNHDYVACAGELDTVIRAAAFSPRHKPNKEKC